MNRVLTLINACGVLALAVLCGLQWQAGRRQDVAVDALTHTRDEQADRLATQSAKLKENADDLADLRQRLTMAESALTDLQTRLAAVIAQRDAAATERDRLAASVAAWQKAVADRDQRLDAMKTQQDQLTAARDVAIAKFNDLADKYNKLVAESKHS